MSLNDKIEFKRFNDKLLQLCTVRKPILPHLLKSLPLLESPINAFLMRSRFAVAYEIRLASKKRGLLVLQYFIPYNYLLFQKAYLRPHLEYYSHPFARLSQHSYWMCRFLNLLFLCHKIYDYPRYFFGPHLVVMQKYILFYYIIYGCMHIKTTAVNKINIYCQTQDFLITSQPDL